MQAVVPITRKFTQIGNPSNIVIQYKAGTNEEPEDGGLKVSVSNDVNGIDMKVRKVVLDMLNGTIQLGRSNLAGFGLKPGVYQGLVHELQTPLLVPSQELTREIFEGRAKVNGLEISKSIPQKKCNKHYNDVSKNTNRYYLF